MNSNHSNKQEQSRAIDALYRISTLSGKELNSIRALEAILDEVMLVFGKFGLDFFTQFQCGLLVDRGAAGVA